MEKTIQERKERLAEIEKNRKLNVDNIGTVVKDFTSINRREGPTDVLPGSFDFMAKTDINADQGSGATAKKEAKAAIVEHVKSSGSRSSGTLGDGGKTTTSSPCATTETSASSAAPATKSKVGEVGPHSEMEQVENYNNFVITHEVSLQLDDSHCSFLPVITHCALNCPTNTTNAESAGGLQRGDIL